MWEEVNLTIPHGKRPLVNVFSKICFWYQRSWLNQVKTKHLIVFIKILGKNYITIKSAFVVRNCYLVIFCQLYSLKTV